MCISGAGSQADPRGILLYMQALQDLRLCMRPIALVVWPCCPWFNGPEPFKALNHRRSSTFHVSTIVDVPALVEC